MLIGLAIRDVVLIESLDLSPGPGLTALTGETGAGKSIILDALGLAAGARADLGLVRRGASQAAVTAIFAPASDAPVWAYLDDKGLAGAPDEDLVLRRTLSADGRSRAFVNDQAVGVGVLRDLGALLMEVHGQHETVGLLDARTHLGLLDKVGGCEALVAACRDAWTVWRAADGEARERSAARERTSAEARDLGERLAELDRLGPRPGEVVALTEERALLGAAEKTLADIAQARDCLDGQSLSSRLGQAFRALDRARQRVAGLVSPSGPDGGEGGGVVRLIAAACEALDRALIETAEATAAVDAAAEAFAFDPKRLEDAEERLFALRAMARKLNVDPDALATERAALAGRLLALESADDAVAEAQGRAAAARAGYLAAAGALTAARRAAGDRLAAAVEAELAPLRLDKARFRVAVDALLEDRAGPFGADRVEFQISTLPGAPFQGLAQIASGGELARFALAIKASLAARGDGPQPLMIFDEVDQGVGGAVADAIGVRLRRLSAGAQVLVVTHSPQVAARADAQWRVRKSGEGERVRAVVDVLPPGAREEEIARMLAGAEVTDAARAAARALMDA
jgi:DNA repair protein RecN (Recombination protein N)